MTGLFRSVRPYGVAVAAAVLALAASPDLSAQRFQYHFGGAGCVDGGLHGVKQLAAGGYVAVGESNTTSSGCGGPDALVVVTNPNGTTVWANTYPIGLSSRATDVVEDVLNPGQLIVCGTTSFPSCNTISRDIFIMRLLPTGGVANLQVYGSTNGDDEAWKIIQTTLGGGITNVGDFVVAGSTRNPVPTGPRDGYLLRVDGTLTLLWDWQYGIGSSDDYFYGVAEVPSWLPGFGDLVAAGGSDNLSMPQTDIFVVRASGVTGVVGAAPQNVAWIDVPLQSLSDEARSVVVLGTGPYAGDIVMAGFSNGTTSTSDEVLVVETGPDPCNPLASVSFGDNAGLPDRGLDLVEDANPTSSTGDVVVTGFTNVAGGFGGSDVFLQRVSLGPTMALMAGSRVYGGNGTDEGWSVANATNNNSAETPGYIVNGITQSPNLIGGDPGQLYLIKTDVTLGSLCNDVGVTFSGGPVTTVNTCGTVPATSINNSCGPVFPTVFSVPGFQLCYALPKPAVGSEAEGAVRMAFKEGTVSSYPNPVERGADLHLRFEMNAEASVGLAVSDLLGREVHRTTMHLAKGARTVPVPTASLPAGTYLARVTIGRASSTIGFVVLER